MPFVFGITADKLQTLTGDVNFRIEHTIAARENIFDRFSRLHADLMKVVEARLSGHSRNCVFRRDKLATKDNPNVGTPNHFGISNKLHLMITSDHG